MHASEHRPTKLGLASLGHVYANVIVALGVLEDSLFTTFLEGLQFIIPLSICYFIKRSKLRGGKYTISEKVHYIEKNTLLHGREYGHTTRKRVRIHYTDRSAVHYMEGSNRAIHPSGAVVWYDYTIRRRWKFINVTY